ncbi:hypothetical protein SAMN04489761_1808 [Tenacibaculum sp. MAR_2009_124]|uniref:hypothetical protein n=1 Tax=Tenacibaculum sp. MAR_2009_124 TaxID=1250059 RepID=UPI000896724F|nr:hypothetical protein [Tenacibaculum sp. MAR_2009_124]SEB80064.1 hypothetical protein SAMN04489761_1808 [Tenacibaculum sp. MAR_2009_124]
MENKFRNKLAVITLVSCFSILAFIIIYPFVTTLDGHAATENILFKTLNSATSFFSGIIGVVIGYYFSNKNE